MSLYHNYFLITYELILKIVVKFRMFSGFSGDKPNITHEQNLIVPLFSPMETGRKNSETAKSDRSLPGSQSWESLPDLGQKPTPRDLLGKPEETRDLTSKAK